MYWMIIYFCIIVYILFQKLKIPYISLQGLLTVRVNVAYYFFYVIFSNKVNYWVGLWKLMMSVTNEYFSQVFFSQFFVKTYYVSTA